MFKPACTRMMYNVSLQAVNTKEITGLARSHTVEDFVNLLERKMTHNSGDTVTLSKVGVAHSGQDVAPLVLYMCDTESVLTQTLPPSLLPS